jgi:stage III sporulation protein SpoIIIAA
VVQVSNARVYTTPQSCGASGLSKMLSSVGGFSQSVVELGVQDGNVKAGIALTCLGRSEVTAASVKTLKKRTSFRIRTM